MIVPVICSGSVGFEMSDDQHRIITPECFCRLDAQLVSLPLCQRFRVLRCESLDAVLVLNVIVSAAPVVLRIVFTAAKREISDIGVKR